MMTYTGTNYGGPQFTIGTQTSIRITRNDTGESIALGGTRESFRVRSQDSVEKTDSIDNGGRVFTTIIPGDLEGDIMVARYNGDFDQFIKAQRAQWFAGDGQIVCTITVTTNNPYDDTKTVDTYLNAVMHCPDKGDLTRTKKQVYTIHFYASDCV